MIHPDDHHHDDDDDDHGEATEAPEDKAATPKSIFKVDEIIPIVDSILEQDDKVKRKIHCSVCFLTFKSLIFSSSSRIRTATLIGLSSSPDKSSDSSVIFFHLSFRY